MTFLLKNVGAGVTGDAYTLNGKERFIQFIASNYGSGIKLEGNLGIIGSDPGVTNSGFSPLTYFGSPLVVIDSRVIDLRDAPNGMQIRAVTTAACANVYVKMLPGSLANE